MIIQHEREGNVYRSETVSLKRGSIKGGEGADRERCELAG